MLDFGFYNMDCMEGMKQFSDGYFELAICDPPYGINYDLAVSKNGGKQYGKSLAPKQTYHTANWDKAIPNKEYFDELFRVSKNQIIWGGNYFTVFLPSTKSWVVWDKRCDEKYNNDFGDCELAWCSKGVARVFRFLYNGMIQEDMKHKEYRIHPTQKPVQLYKWLLTNYAKPGDKILDTHVGSASSLIACHELGFKYVGFEIDADYYALAKKRLEQETAQMNILDLMRMQEGNADDS